MEPEISIYEIFAIVILALFFIVVAISFFFGIVLIQAEHVFASIFNRPFYIHYYPFPKKLSESQKYLLRQHSPFYMRLSKKRQGWFEHRVFRFIDHYQFIGREGFEITDEVRIRIAAIYVMLTFGMRIYLIPVMDKIIVYPSIYMSKSTNEYHKGEFNPRVRAVVFSWEDFLSGIDVHNDNVNLGIHEFAHVLHHHGRIAADVSASIFTSVYQRILKEISHPPNRQRLLESDYFRQYGLTNHFEFLAVIVEHYFETPDEFRSTFPELYQNVSRMLNHKHKIISALPA